MQRVRIGLTGLGFVFVAVLLAAALTNAPAPDETVNGSTAPTSAVEEPKEPLAELGVAPSNTDNAGEPTNNAAQRP